MMLKQKLQWLKLDDAAFPERVNHAVACDSYQHMYAFGGLIYKESPRSEHWDNLGEVTMDVWDLNTEYCKWEKIYPPMGSSDYQPSGVLSAGRYALLMSEGFALQCFHYNGNLYLYGGRKDNYGFYSYLFLDIQCFNPITKKWSVVEAKGNLPQGRFGHACAVNGPTMYIQGGIKFDRYFVCTNELRSFNFETCTWSDELSQLTEGDSLPLARDFHSGVYINNRIVIFGGRCRYPNNEDEDGFYEFLISNREWGKITTTGYRPPGRRSLSATPYGEKSIIYFGGFSTAYNIFYSDVFILDTEKREILKLKPFGMGPCPRRRMGMCLVKSELIICGGVGLIQEEGHHKELTCMTFGDTYSLQLLSTLEHLCKEAILFFKLSLENLPLPIQNSIKQMSTATSMDAQEYIIL